MPPFFGIEDQDAQNHIVTQLQREESVDHGMPFARREIAGRQQQKIDVGFVIIVAASLGPEQDDGLDRKATTKKFGRVMNGRSIPRMEPDLSDCLQCGRSPHGLGWAGKS